MTDDGVAHDPNDHGELADFGAILFGAMALVAVLALVWAFGAALGPAGSPDHAAATSMTRTLQHLR